MQYIKPFTYFVTKKPGGWMNLLYGCVCVLIPVVGPIVLLGYRAEMAEDLDKDPRLEEYPNFDFNRFIEYLTRGVWPFLMQLIVTAVMMAVMMVVIGIGILAAYATREPWIGFAIGGVLFIPMTLLTMLILWPLELHTQLAGRFEFGRACSFTVRFLRQVWGQALLAALAYWFISILLAFLGYAALCVGIYPVIVILGMAQQHFVAQLYRLYLDEGGDPIAGPLEQLEFDEE